MAVRCVCKQSQDTGLQRAKVNLCRPDKGGWLGFDRGRGGRVSFPNGYHVTRKRQHRRGKLRGKRKTGAAVRLASALQLDLVGPVDVLQSQFVGARGTAAFVFHGGTGQRTKVIRLSDDDRLELVNGPSHLFHGPLVTVGQFSHPGRDGSRVGSLEVGLRSDDIRRKLDTTPRGDGMGSARKLDGTRIDCVW